MKEILKELAIKSSLYLHQFVISDPRGITAYIQIIDKTPTACGLNALLNRQVLNSYGTEYFILDGFAISGNLNSSTSDYYPIVFYRKGGSYKSEIYVRQLSNGKAIEATQLYLTDVQEYIIPLNNTRERWVQSPQE